MPLPVSGRRRGVDRRGSANVLTYADLWDVVLVGTSSNGAVVVGVADADLAQLLLELVDDGAADTAGDDRPTSA